MFEFIVRLHRKLRHTHPLKLLLLTRGTFTAGSILLVRNVLILFCDSIGIPHDKLSVIFEDFEQVESTLSQTVQGAGLGLAIVARIVKNMNG